MKNSVKYLLVFLLLFFVLDFSIGLLMKSIFPNTNFGMYGKINKSLTVNKSILIFGSSRAANHYDPAIISKETGLTCYNTGLGGYGLYYNYAVLAELVKSHQPDVIILDLAPNVIVDRQSFSKLNIFMPYYFAYPSFNKIIKLDPEFSSFKTFFKTYVYNSTLYDVVRGLLSNQEQGNGYHGLKSQIDTSLFKPMYLSSEATFPEAKKEYLNKFIDIATQHHIKLICLISPTYEKFDKENIIIDELRTLIVAKGIVFYDYSDYDMLYNKPKYFRNQLHMNATGVKVFNNEVSKLINDR